MIIGARGSDLAQWQANWVGNQLSAIGIAVQIKVISTIGDRDHTNPLNEIGVQGVFTKEIEEALLAREIDLAVHSLKDMSLDQPEELAVIAISRRADPADLLIARRDTKTANNPFGLPNGAVVGSSAVRRAAQLQAKVSNVSVKNLRGNVPTRLEKLRRGDYDAIFLAAAGIERLGIDLSEFRVTRLDPEVFLPSPGQGALALEMRSDDPLASKVRAVIHHDETALAIDIERTLLRKFGGGCSLPLGAYARLEKGVWQLNAFWGGNPAEPRWAAASGSNVDLLLSQVYSTLSEKGEH